MIVFSLTENSVVLILLNLIEGDQGVASLALQSFSEDTVLVILRESVHQNVRLS